jgi:hypothetical protein
MPTPEEIAEEAAKKKEAEEAANKARIEQEAKELAEVNARKTKEELQAELDVKNKRIKELNAENKERREKLEYFEAEEKKRANAQLSETEQLQKKASDLAAENAKIKGDLLRRAVIEEAGLPSSFAERLKGETKDELLADALELAKLIPQPKTAPKLQPTNPPSGQPVDAIQETRNWLNGSYGNPFDSANVKEKGGGVFGTK